MKLVLDTNVLISGMYFGGVPAEILDLWADNRFMVYATPGILKEYLRAIEEMDVKTRETLGPHWGKMLPKVCHFINDSQSSKKFSRDPDDDKFIHCAIDSGSDYLVTGDEDLTNVSLEFDFKILSPRQFLNILEQ